MAEDGNCLYRSVAHQIYGNADKHMNVREECCNYITDNQDFFKLYIPDFVTWVKKKRKSHEWGDHVDIIAMSELFNVSVKIFELNMRTKDLSTKEFPEVSKSSPIKNLPTLLLSRHRQRHYNAVRDPNSDLPFKGDFLRKKDVRQARIEAENKKVVDDEKEQLISRRSILRRGCRSEKYGRSFRTRWKFLRERRRELLKTKN